MKSNYSRWLKRIIDTQEVEIDCTTCLNQISQYVDLELATGSAVDAMPQVSQHLGQCPVCNEEYQVLRDLAHLEVNGLLPTNEELSEKLKRKHR